MVISPEAPAAQDRGIYLLLSGPSQEKVCECDWWDDIEELSFASPVGVEDGCVRGASKRPLSVGGDGISDNAFLGLRAWRPGLDAKLHHVGLC